MKRTESGITVFHNFEDIQLQNCEAHINLNGKGLSEIDFVWYDDVKRTVFFVEAKEIQLSILSNKTKINERHIIKIFSRR